MAQHYELNDRQWAAIEPLLPKQGRGGAWKAHRTIINGISWRLHTGASWRDLPERYGPWQTVYDRFVRWRRDGPWLRLMGELQHVMRLEDELDLDVLFVDSSVVRATRATLDEMTSSQGEQSPTSPGGVPWQARSGVVPCRAPTGEHALPRHDPKETPPEKRRAEKGSVVLKQLVRHTLQSAADLEALAKRWKCNGADAVRRALREAAERGE